jgi:DNA-nicking Smr family endonuclease
VSKGNKYIFVPDEVLDLHGLTGKEAAAEVADLRSRYDRGTHLRIIIGKGTHSRDYPVIPHVVRNALMAQAIPWNYAKQKDGGEGAIDCVIMYK